MAEEFECGECGRTFDTKRGLSSHQAQKHNDEESDTEDREKWTFTMRKPSLSGRNSLIAVLILGVLIGFTAGYMSPDISNLDLGEDEEPAVDISKIDNEGDPVLGDKDAPVTMVIYEDFQCPFCKRFEDDTVEQVEKEYVESGDVKIVWKDFPLERIHPQAFRTSEVMECVYRQDNEAFWRVKDRIFREHESLYPRGAGGYDTTEEEVQEKLLGWISEAGISEENVRDCLENGDPGLEVRSDTEEGRGFETMIPTPQGDREFVSGTPGTVIYAEGDTDGRPIVGAQPFSAVQTVIEEKLQN